MEQEHIEHKPIIRILYTINVQNSLSIVQLFNDNWLPFLYKHSYLLWAARDLGVTSISRFCSHLNIARAEQT